MLFSLADISQHPYWFLFLRVLKRFTSPRLAPITGHPKVRFSFRNSRFNGCVRLAGTFRSLPRPSSLFPSQAIHLMVSACKSISAFARHHEHEFSRAQCAMMPFALKNSFQRCIRSYMILYMIISGPVGIVRYAQDSWTYFRTRGPNLARVVLYQAELRAQLT